VLVIEIERVLVSIIYYYRRTLYKYKVDGTGSKLCVEFDESTGHCGVY